MNSIPMPPRIAKLPRDARGYPVPYIVMRDKTGKPLFAANDADLVHRCLKQKLCPTCGEKLGKEKWFIGGPNSAFHPNGAYIDSAEHYECATYSLQACPHLSRPDHQQYLSEKVIAKMQTRVDEAQLLIDPTMTPGRPDVFVLVMSFGQQFKPAPIGQNPYVVPLRPYHAVEFWQHGERLAFADGLEIVRKIRGLDLSALRLLVP